MRKKYGDMTADELVADWGVKLNYETAQALIIYMEDNKKRDKYLMPESAARRMINAGLVKHGYLKFTKSGGYVRTTKGLYGKDSFE